MSRPETQIKNVIASHLRLSLFGREIYGHHEDKFFDGKEYRVLVIEVRGASRFERYGQVIVYHPTLGKWVATLLSEHHSGKPVRALSAEEIRANITAQKSEDFLYRVYGGPIPKDKIVLWDPYWDAPAGAR